MLEMLKVQDEQDEEFKIRAAAAKATMCYKVPRYSHTQLCEQAICWQPNRLVPAGEVERVNVVHSSFVSPRGRLAEFIFTDGLRVYVAPAYDDKQEWLYFFIQAGARVIQSDC